MQPALLRRYQAPLAVLAVALAYGIAAAVSLALTQGTDGIATMWPSSGILLAGLLILPRRLSAFTVAGCAIASFIANTGAGGDVVHSVGYTFANMVEGSVAAFALRRWCGGIPSLLDPRHVLRFGLVVVAAAALSAGIAATVPPAAGLGFALSWFTTVLLGLVLIAPLILAAVALSDPAQASQIRLTSTAELTGLLLVVALVTSLVFGQTRFPLLFLPLVALLAATFRGGTIGAITGTTIIAAIASVQTGMRMGPVVLIPGDHVVAVPFLQFYLFTLFATALPLAAIMAQREQLAQQNAASERRHRLLADHASDIIVRFTPGGVPLYASPAVERLLGYPPREAITRSAIRDVHPDDRALVIAAWQRVLAGDEHVVCTYRQQRRDGSHAWLEATYRPIAAVPGGTVSEVVSTIRDVSQRRIAELAAQEAGARIVEANRLLSMAERMAQVGHWHIDVRTGAMGWSPEVFRLHGVEGPDAPSYEGVLALYHPDDRGDVEAMIRRSVETGEAVEFEARIIHAGGDLRYVYSRGQATVDEAGRVTGVFGVIQDVTRQAQAELELNAARLAAEEAAGQAIRLADTDALTGVASRRRALEFLEGAVADAEQSGRSLAVAIFDIDHFKTVNDRFGHAIGDRVLRRTAQAAATMVRPTDLVGRLGGEEFVVVLPGLSQDNGVMLADRLRIAVEASVAPGDPPVTISIGLAIFQVGTDAAALLDRADQALYRAKAAGRNILMLAA